MQKTTSQKALKVISIIMIVFAALTLLLGIGGIVTGGALGILGAGIGDAGSAALVGGVAAVAGFVILLGGLCHCKRVRQNSWKKSFIISRCFCPFFIIINFTCFFFSSSLFIIVTDKLLLSVCVPLIGNKRIQQQGQTG